MVKHRHWIETLTFFVKSNRANTCGCKINVHKNTPPHTFLECWPLTVGSMNEAHRRETCFSFTQTKFKVRPWFLLDFDALTDFAWLSVLLENVIQFVESVLCIVRIFCGHFSSNLWFEHKKSRLPLALQFGEKRQFFIGWPIWQWGSS